MVSGDHLPAGMKIHGRRDLFRAHGCYLVRIQLTRNAAGGSTDHALVVLPTADADKAIDALDGYEIDARAQGHAAAVG